MSGQVVVAGVESLGGRRRGIGIWLGMYGWGR